MSGQLTRTEGKNIGLTYNSQFVSVIIVTWNKEKDVTRLLEQFRHINYPEDRFEITVVDNNSTDNTVQIIESTYPSVRLIKNPENLGGAGGFNAGMRWVLQNRPEAKYMWLLDNDVLIDRNALRELVTVLEHNTHAAMCGSRIMNIADREETLEVGAFIDYRLGRSRRNVPIKEQPRHKDGLFEVDYVSACSLLVRKECVTKLGLLNDDLFIYWDDKEWGARFNASGYKVLASSASVVYHPDWAGGRIADSSAIWRCYYGARNCLWFYNTYVFGVRRRLLLARIIIDWVDFALAACMSARLSLSRATIKGIEDFFKDCYGKKNFQMPAENIDEHFTSHMVKKVCVFVPSAVVSEGAEGLVSDLMKKCPGIEIISIVPDEVQGPWASLSKRNNVIAYGRSSNGTIPWVDRLRIVKFLHSQSWSVLLIPPPSLRVAGLFGRHVAVVDFDKGAAISIEKMTFSDLLRIPFVSFSFLVRALVSPPEPKIQWPFQNQSHPLRPC